jgi:uncharacterized MAPEG superfamily protein
MDILEELRAMEREHVCKTCDFLASRPAAERAQWEEALADESYPSFRIAKLMRKIAGETAPGETAVKAHRAKHSGR